MENPIFPVAKMPVDQIEELARRLADIEPPEARAKAIAKQLRGLIAVCKTAASEAAVEVLREVTR